MCSFCRLCQSAAAPRSNGNGSASGGGYGLTEAGDCALAGAHRMKSGSADTTMPSMMRTRFFDCSATLPFSLATLFWNERNFTFARSLVNEKSQDVLVLANFDSANEATVFGSSTNWRPYEPILPELT